MAALHPRTFCTAFAMWILVTGCASRAHVENAQPAQLPPKPSSVAEPVVSPKVRPGLCALAKDVDPLPAPSLIVDSAQVSQDNLSATVNTLANPTLHGREAGSIDNRRVARWIADRFAAIGLSPSPGADHCVPFDRNGVQDQNVIGHLNREPQANGRVVIVGAHYDAQGQQGTDVFPGADDNASGVAAILEIARISALHHSGIDMVFVAFGAEERGLLGAKAYVNAPSVPLDRVALMINLDMVGRPLLDGSPMRFFIPRANETLGYIIGNFDKPRTDDILQRAAEREDRPIVGIPEVVMTRLGFGSDSVPFGPHVPTIFLSTGDHADYHKPSDTPEKIDFEQIARAVRLSLAIIDEVESPKDP